MHSRSLYTPPDESLWCGREDGLRGERFYSRIICQTVEAYEPHLSEVVLIGFACDEGVRRNFGRVGARLGPLKIREQLRSLACHLPSSVKITDLGDLHCEGENLEEAQEALAEVVSLVRGAGKVPFVLGGGHETAWATYQGLERNLGNSKLGIVNFDAHFDLRACDEKTPASSGTPFYQVAKHCEKKNREFHYACLGVQESANTKVLFDRASDLGVLTVKASEMRENQLSLLREKLEQFVSEVDEVYVSLCLDVFSSALAPGVSAPCPFGVSLEPTLSLLEFLSRSPKICAFEVVELSPPLDTHNLTSKLAAWLTGRVFQDLEKVKT